MDNLETVALFLMPVIVSVISLIVFIRIYTIGKKVNKINESIELKQKELDQNIIDNIGPVVTVDLSGRKERNKKTLEQSIQKLQREKKYLLEEINIFKIFKK